MKRQATDLEKTVVIHTSDKSPIKNRVHILQINEKKTQNPMQKWAKVLSRHFTEEDMQITNLKRIPLFNRQELQAKTIMKEYYIYPRMTK